MRYQLVKRKKERNRLHINNIFVNFFLGGGELLFFVNKYIFIDNA